MARQPIYIDPLDQSIATPPGGEPPPPTASPGDTGEGPGPTSVLTGLSKIFEDSKTLGGKSKGGGGDPSSSGGGAVGAGKSYDPDNMIRTYLPGLSPDQQQAVRQALRGAEGGSGVAYHQALDKLVQQYPQLQSYTPMGRAFPPQTPGQMTPDQQKQLWDLASKYEQPYIDAMQNTSNQMGTYLKQLMPSLPKGYQSLVKAQMEGPGGLLNLPTQVSNLIHQENPAAIANAYALAYGGTGTGTTTPTAASLLAGLGTKLPGST